MAAVAGQIGLSLEDAARILAPFDLKPRRVRALASGATSARCRVETDGGPILLRLDEGRTEADLRWEGALLWHLGARGYPTPQPLRRADGRPFVAHGGRWVTAFPWVAGAAIDEAAITPARCGAVGGVLAALHNAGAGFPERRDGNGAFERMVQRIDQRRSEPRRAEVMPLVDEEIAFARAHRAAALPSGVIHGDLMPGKVRWRGGQPIVVDFEQAGCGRFAYDLAVALLGWCFAAGDLDEARARALLGGYGAVRPVAPEERAALWVEARLAALRSLAARGGGREDLDEDLARLDRLRALGADGLAARLGLDAAPDGDAVNRGANR